MVAEKSLEAININLSRTTFITHGKKSIMVKRVPSVQERKTDIIGKRPPYAYTSACPDERWRR